MADTPLRQRVEKGARWLEEQGAHDWPEKILTAVEAQRFEMCGSCSCVVGVTLGDWEDHFLGIWQDGDGERASYGESSARGFTPMPDEKMTAWAALEAEWTAYAREELRLRQVGR